MIASNVESIPESLVTGVSSFPVIMTIDDSSIATVPSVVAIQSQPDLVIPTNTPAPPLVSTPTFDDTLLTLPLSQLQFVKAIVTIAGVDVTDQLVNGLNIGWPDEGGGTCAFTLRAENPFATVPTTGITIEDLVVVTGSLIDSTGEAFSAVIFRGRVVEIGYNPDTDTLTIGCQDASRDVSHDTDKLDQEILQVDPVITEVRTAGTDRIVVSKRINLDISNPILGIWNESDTALFDNLADKFEFIVTPPSTIDVVAPTGIIIAGRPYTVRYQVPLSAFNIPVVTKSVMIDQIARLAGIVSLKNERVGQVEDEIIRVNVVANKEFALDIMRKLVIPQTWKVEYDQAGDLIIRREVLKTAANADFTFDEDIILENTLSITKQTDSVINEQGVNGVTKQRGVA